MDNELIPRVTVLIALLGGGILMVWLAGATASGRVKRNSLVGIRTPRTMRSDETWAAAHHRAKGSTRAAGAVSIAGGAVALLPLPVPAIMVAALVAAVIMLLFVLYGAKVGGDAADAVTTD